MEGKGNSGTVCVTGVTAVALSALLLCRYLVSVSNINLGILLKIIFLTNKSIV